MAEAITTATALRSGSIRRSAKAGRPEGLVSMLLSLAELIVYPELRAVATDPRVAKAKIASLMESTLGSAANLQQRQFCARVGRQSAFAVASRNCRDL